MTDPIDRPYLETVDPNAAQQGVDSPGPQAGWTDLINFGVYNGNFRLGPPQAASNIDVASSVSGSNFVPGWRFVQSSNATITAQVVRNTSTPSGSNFRFVLTNAASGDEAFIEQVIDVGGSQPGIMSNIVRTAHDEDLTSQTARTLRLQYLTADGTITGMPPEVTVTTALSRILASAEEDTSGYYTPPAARYLRVRVSASALLGPVTKNVNLYEVRRERGGGTSRLIDVDTSSSATAVTLMNKGNETIARINTNGDILGIGAGGSVRLLSRQLIAIPFVLLNVPANATTEMQIADNALGLGTPRIQMGWGGDIVGLHYRMSTDITAGGASALRIQATVAGSSVWTAHTLTTTSAQFDSGTQALGTDTFSATQNVGVQVVTSATFAPTTLDLACLLFVALKYDGGL